MKEPKSDRSRIEQESLRAAQDRLANQVKVTTAKRKFANRRNIKTIASAGVELQKLLPNLLRRARK